MAKTAYWPWQNPTWPENRDLTAEDMEAMAREASMARAQSPNPLVCKIDGKWSIDDQFHHHGFNECMDYRHANVIGDDEPWTSWWLIDDASISPKGPIPPVPIGMSDWNLRASVIDPTVNLPPSQIPPPTTPSQKTWQLRAQPYYGVLTVPNNYDTWSGGWNGYTLAVQVVSSALAIIDPGFAIRLTLLGTCTINKLFIGPCSSDGDWIASALYQMTFNGGNATVTSDGNNAIITDPLEVAIDSSNGFIITFYIDPGGDGTLAGSTVAYPSGDPISPGWSLRYVIGDLADNPNKSDLSVYTSSPVLSVMLVLDIEGLYIANG
jgi:hypothetical protein